MPLSVVFFGKRLRTSTCSQAFAEKRWSLGSARAALAWGLFFFLALQGAFNVVVDCWRPDFYDAEFGVRLKKLRARLREHPERATLLLMGSSRCVMNFLPETLPELRTADGRTVLPFNFSHLAAGPVMNLMEYRRLRRLDIRPDYLVLEVMPPCLSNDAASTPTVCATALDLPTLHGYIEPGKLYGRFLLRRLVPWYRQRGEVLDRLAPGWVLAEEPPERRKVTLGPLGGDRGWQTPASVTAERGRQCLGWTHDSYLPRLQAFQITPEATRAYDEILQECRRDGIAVALLLTPEGDAFRSWYPPQALAQIDAWCAAMRRRHGVPVIDARRWLPEEDFLDSHHVWRAGALAFTRRFGDEVLRPLVEGRLSAETSAQFPGGGRP
jgi:hypothetical protein